LQEHAYQQFHFLAWLRLEQGRGAPEGVERIQPLRRFALVRQRRICRTIS